MHEEESDVHVLIVGGYWRDVPRARPEASRRLRRGRPPTSPFLGDAIHAMTPDQGVGANTALRDAALLARQLAAANDGPKSLLEAVADHEAEMFPFGFARVADSLAQNGTSGSDPLHKSVIGRVLLAFNRTYFRAVDWTPPSGRSSSTTSIPTEVAR